MTLFGKSLDVKLHFNASKGLVTEGISFGREYTSNHATFFKLSAEQKV